MGIWIIRGRVQYLKEKEGKACRKRVAEIVAGQSPGNRVKDLQELSKLNTFLYISYRQNHGL